jgi:hypothetical protein
VKWIGGARGPQETEEMAQVIAREHELDRITANIDECLRNLAESEEFRNHAWMSQDDLLKLAGAIDLSLFALQGPSDLTIELPDEEAPTKHKLVCTSASGTVELIPIRSVAA